MQEETTQKTIALAIKTSKLTASVLQKAMKMYLEHQKHKEPSHGKIPVKKLVGQGAGAKSIEVTDDNIKAFERVARKYNVDFAVKRTTTSLDVTVRAPAGAISQITADNVRVVVDLTNYKATSGTVAVPAKVYVDGFSDAGAIGEYVVNVHFTGG